MVDAPASPIATQETEITSAIKRLREVAPQQPADPRLHWLAPVYVHPLDVRIVLEALFSAERRNEELVRERDAAVLRAVEAETNDEVSREFLATADRKVTKYAAGDGWKPIETAPKDGTPFLGWMDMHPRPEAMVVRYQPGHGRPAQYGQFVWAVSDYNTIAEQLLVAWRPLPRPPGEPEA